MLTFKVLKKMFAGFSRILTLKCPRDHISHNDPNVLQDHCVIV